MLRQGGNPGRLAAIDSLRGVAVLAVLLSHLQFSLKLAPERHPSALADSLALPAPLASVLGYGAFGVNLFLVISGFCIHMQWARLGQLEASIDFLAFWRRRMRRLYPPYLVALISSFAGLFVLFAVLGHATGIAASFGYGSERQLFVDVVLLLLLAQNLNGASHRVGNAPFWTLALEEQLYLLYFPLLWVRRRAGWRGAVAFVAVVSLGWRLVGVLLGESEPEAWHLLGPSRWIEWVLGAIAVEGHLGRVTIPRWMKSFLLGTAFLAAAVALHSPLVPRVVTAIVGDAAFGWAFFVLLNSAIRVARWPLGIDRVFGILGLFSYSLYLTHEPVIVAVKQAGLRIGLPVGVILALRLLAPIALAYLFFLVVEKRFLSRPATRERSADGAPEPITSCRSPSS